MLLAHRLLTRTAGLRPPRPRLRRAPPCTRAVHRGATDMRHLPRPCRARLWMLTAHSQTLPRQGLVACRVRMRHHLESQTRHESVGRCSMQIHTRPCGRLWLRVGTLHRRVMNHIRDTDEKCACCVCYDVGQFHLYARSYCCLLYSSHLRFLVVDAILRAEPHTLYKLYYRADVS